MKYEVKSGIMHEIIVRALDEMQLLGLQIENRLEKIICRDILGAVLPPGNASEFDARAVDGSLLAQRWNQMRDELHRRGHRKCHADGRVADAACCGGQYHHSRESSW